MEGMPKVLAFNSRAATDPTLEGSSILSIDNRKQQWLATISAASPLEKISAALKDKGLTVPHGECPKVNIGGHVQTGGYGHQMRGLGLCLDYVYSFRIVIYDGKDSKPKIVDVYRPELKNISGKHALNDKIYKGVLGGSPGAFGVLIQVTFLCVSDQDPAVSKSYNRKDLYSYLPKHTGAVVSSVVESMLKFTDPAQPLLPGIDVFVSVVSNDFFPNSIFGFTLGVVLLELAYTGNAFSLPAKQQIESVVNACSGGVIAAITDFFGGKPLAQRPPSEVAHDGVRVAPFGITQEGREFDLAYKKRVNVTLRPVTEARAKTFANKIGELAQRVISNWNLKLVIQTNVGGGKNRVESNDAPDSLHPGRPFTGIPYRNQTFGFVFDVFYRGEDARVEAEAIQQEITDLLNEIGEFDHRLQWGSFEREKGLTNMTKPEVREYYYGSQGAYDNIQSLKREVDPKGLFTTEFTVQNN